MNDLEKAILDMIQEIYKRKFIGRIKVTKIKDQESYILRLYVHQYDPIVIAADMNAEDFLNFVRKELVSRQLIKSEFFNVVKADDKGRTCIKN